MVNRRNLRGLISGVAAMLFVSATTMANRINLPYAGTLGGKQVAAGNYKITWEHHSPTATVTLADGRKLVATAEGKIEERSTKFARKMVVYTTQSDGSQAITEIRLGGTTMAIVFAP